MKKFFLVLVLAVFAVSCSKKVEVQGKITGGSPLERMEFIEASGVATLPLVNIGINKDGNFSGSFDAPKAGIYLINYAGNQAYVYLKGGQKLNFTANAFNFAETLKVTGDAQKNNDFLKQTQTFVSSYASKIDMGALIAKGEAEFLKEAQKIKTDLDKNADETAKKVNPDSEVVKFKKEEIGASILGLLSQYEINHPMAVQNPSFKVSQKFRDYVKELEKNNDKLVKDQPMYRNYLLNKLSSDYQTFASGQKKDEHSTNAAIFSKFLDTRKDLSQVSKDYLLAYVMSQFDISSNLDAKKSESLTKLIDEKIKDNTVKKELKRILFVIGGPNIGTPAEESGMQTTEGKSFKFSELKGKPVFVMFYASWNPTVKEAALPVIKEVSAFYKAKMNFVYVNMDDSKDQFVKTSAAMFKGIAGTNVYADGGINSKLAEKWGIYSFKMPSFILLDKDGKVATKFYYNLADPTLTVEMEKLTGLKAPTQAPQATLHNDFLQPQPQETK